MSMHEEDVIQPMSQEDAWEFLGSQEFGRLAFAVAGDPEIVPINFCATNDKVYFRTAEGSKLLGLTINKRVALETDKIDGDSATSSRPPVAKPTIWKMPTAALIVDRPRVKPSEPRMSMSSRCEVPPVTEPTT